MSQFWNVDVGSIQGDGFRLRRRHGDPFSSLNDNTRATVVVIVFHLDNNVWWTVNDDDVARHFRRFDENTSALFIQRPADAMIVFVRVPDPKFSVVGDANQRQEVWINVETSNLLASSDLKIPRPQTWTKNRLFSEWFYTTINKGLRYTFVIYHST